MRRNAVLIFVIIGAVLSALALAIPSLLNIDRYRPMVVSYLQEKLGKEVEIGRLTLKIVPLSLGVEDFGVKNPGIFPSGYVVKIAHAEAELDPRALLHRQVIIKSLVLDPGSEIRWNFENPQAKGSQTGRRQPSKKTGPSASDGRRFDAVSSPLSICTLLNESQRKGPL
jgi:uncharacterized protein involved in outer membrane biogenesis